MKFTTKYNIDDVGFAMKDNKIIEIKISSINIDHLERRTLIKYQAYNMSKTNPIWQDITIFEEDICKTKQELLDTL